MEIIVKPDLDNFCVNCPFKGDRNECNALGTDVNFCPINTEDDDGIYGCGIPDKCPLRDDEVTVRFDE